VSSRRFDHHAASHLVVVDMQRVFADPSSGWATPGFAAIVPTVAALVQRCAPAVTFTRFVAPRSRAAPGAGTTRSGPSRCNHRTHRSGTWWELAPAGATVDATTFSKWGPELAERVGPATLVLAGVSTDCCVLSTAVAAADAGVAVQVVADACAGVDDASHRKALDLLALYAPLVEVVTSAEVR
jgi:nicotinamidase-related amidase